MDDETLEEFTQLGASGIKGDLNKYFNAFFAALRSRFVFDNIAIYKTEKNSGIPDAVYARAVGRGRSKEADASWGEELANQVIASGKIMNVVPSRSSARDRTLMPYRLGLPLELTPGRGALIFVRFGGPEFSADQLPFAVLAANQVAYGLEHEALQAALTQLEFAHHRAQLQDDFIATISHELHTPLGFIKGYTTSLLRPDTTWDQATQREFLTIIDEETDHLIQLIDRMLDSARLQAGTLPMDFQPVRLDSLLRDVAMRFQSRYQGLEVSLDLEPAPPLRADSVRLTQVLSNLFDNAIKYAPGSPIEISLHLKKDRQVITFSDHGVGIPPQHLPFLFERFYRVEGRSPRRGTGLGLFICKQIIQAHKGQISVRTVPGKGTSFCIELPADENVPEREEYVSPNPGG